MKVTVLNEEQLMEMMNKNPESKTPEESANAQRSLFEY